MLRAEAAEFTPQESGSAEFGGAEYTKAFEEMATTGEYPASFEAFQAMNKDINTAAHDVATAWEELCSTAAPSPALNAVGASPMFSPYWGMSEEWTGHSAFGSEFSQAFGGMSEAEQFVLPESANGEVDSLSPAYVAGGADGGPCFVLSGMEDLQSSLASFLSKRLPDSSDSEESSKPAGMSLPPGLDLPPGLEFMAGADSEDVALPPGLEGSSKKKKQTTVAELHAKLSKKGKGKVAEAAVEAAEDEEKVQTSVAEVLPQGCTTAMLRNIPNKYTQIMLMEQLYEDGFKGDLDFIYLPIDFKNKCNVGYAFLNFRTPEACAVFASEYHMSNSREKLPGFNSKKVCEVSAARFQGRQENVRRLQASAVMAELVGHPDWLPMLFDENGQAVEFPVPEDAPKESSTRSGRGGRLSRRGRTQTA